MDEEEWIKSNIQQRICTVFCKYDDEHPNGCKCFRHKDSHVSPDSVNTEVWTLSKNTRAERCRDFGNIQFGDTKSSKFVRIDVETEISTAESLLIDVWKLSKPKWILSMMGDVYESEVPEKEHEEKEKDKEKYRKENELKKQIQKVLKSLSNGQNIWITSEGLNFGLAKMVGEAIEEVKDVTLRNVTPVGIFAWGGCQSDALKSLSDEKSLHVSTEGNRPSVLYPHHLLVDDGTVNPSYVFQSFQDFRMRLETSLANHTDTSNSTPLVTILYGGWSYVTDGVKKAIENNIPIVVLQGTGGFAEILASLFENSKEDKLNVGTIDSSQKWTGTVIDDVLRKGVKEKFKDVYGDQYKAAEHMILQCLQKRELITFVDIDTEENALTKAIIKALLKCKSVPEVLRLLDYYMPARLFEGEGAAVKAIKVMKKKEKALSGKSVPEVLRLLDYYMPARMFEGEGAAAAAIQVMKTKEKALSETAGLFLFEALLMDQSEFVQFIIDYEGVDLKGFVKDMSSTNDMPLSCSKVNDMFSLCEPNPDESEEQAYQVLLMWAIQSQKTKCAALFWKKGKHLLASSLLTSLVLRSLNKKEENIGGKKTLEEHAVLFENRARGLINECYDNDKERTIYLIQSQSLRNIWRINLIECCLKEGNRKIFATEAFKEYVDRIWYGKINPPKQKIYNKLQQSKPKQSCSVFKRFAVQPVMKYILNLVFYIVFLSVFGHTLLFELGPKYSFLEGILVVWWLTFVWEECRQFMNTHDFVKTESSEKASQCCYGTLCFKFRAYFLENYWNILDFVCLLFFLIGGILMTVYHLDITRTDVYQAARFFLSVDIMVFTWRILQHLAIVNIMGPTLEMIYQMMKDLFPFLVIMFVFIISQGLAAHALLYPNRDWSPDAFLDIPKSAFWNVFGELGLDDIEASENQEECSSDPLLFQNDTKNECPSELGKYAVPFLLGMYMLLMNVLLLNLLIARFSFTFQEVHNQTEWLAAWQQARVTLEFYRKPPLPPPFNVIFDILYMIYIRTCGKENDVLPEPKEDETLASWEKSMAEYYLASAEFKSGSERMSIIRENKDRNQEAAMVKILQTFKQHPGNTDETARSTVQPVTEKSDPQSAKLTKLIEGLSKRMKGLESSQREIIKRLESTRVTPPQTSGGMLIIDDYPEENQEEYV